jgi:two-component system response regulator HydG
MTVKSTIEPKGSVLVVDDQRNMRTTTALLLRAVGFTVEEADGGEQALERLSQHIPDVMVTDLKMEPMDGLTLLTRALEVAPRLQVILMTAYGSIETAVEAMRNGAYDYMTKPFKEGELVHRVERALEKGRLQSTVDLFAGEFKKRHELSGLLGNSPVMRDLTSRIARVAASDATVLIQGESGTGKELVARAIHALSARSRNPFVPVNCAAINESLLESELFGHAKGSFTGAVKARRGIFEEAHGGTVFIDEVTETTQAFQTKLLRVLQEGDVRRVGESTSVKVDVRTVAATNRNIEIEVAEKRFRQDLFYRLAVVPIIVPPLRDRLDDVPLLAATFLARANTRNRFPRRISAAAVDHLLHYTFPGNVRELENLIEQAAALSESEELGPEDFPLRRRSGEFRLLQPANQQAQTLADAVSDAERRAIEAAIERCGSELTGVADQLGISATTLWRKMKRLEVRAGGQHRADIDDDRA